MCPQPANLGLSEGPQAHKKAVPRAGDGLFLWRCELSGYLRAAAMARLKPSAEPAITRSSTQKASRM